MRDREILKPDDTRNAVHVACVDAADRLVRIACGDPATVERLATMLREGAIVEVRVALPAGKVAVQLVRGDTRETLAVVDPTPMRQVVN